jgi:hypothetical protein
MAQGAKVDSIDAVKIFRAALIKFAEVGNVALTAADSDIDRVQGWLERDQTVYWAGQLRKRHEEVIRCEEAVREKRLTKNFDGTTKSAVDEMKALTVAKRRREEAEQKCLMVKKAIQVLRKEAQLYKGRTQRLATSLQGDLPRAVHQIDNMLSHLETYLSLQTAGEGISIGEAAESMAQAASSRVGIERLRDRTPTPQQRQAAAPRALAPDDSFFQPWAAGAVQDWQREAVAKLAIERQIIDPEQKIIIARNSWQQQRIYLERMTPESEQDSGWFLGEVDRVEGEKIEYDAIRVGDLIAARPDLMDLLALPPGFLIALDAGGPSAMLDGAGLDVWAVALISGEPSAEAPGEASAAQPSTETTATPAATE